MTTKVMVEMVSKEGNALSNEPFLIELKEHICFEEGDQLIIREVVD